MALGHKSVEACQEHISSWEFSEWLAYDQIEPFGHTQDREYFGTIAASIANTMRHKNSDHVFTADDFYPSWETREKKTQAKPVDALLAKAEMLNAMFGGIDARNQKPQSA